MLASGCAASLDVFSFGPPPPPNHVRIYSSDQLAGVTYTSLASIEATSCQPLMWDAPPSEQDATEKLKDKASSLKANGITNIACHAGASGWIRRCWASLVCRADAIQVPQARASLR